MSAKRLDAPYERRRSRHCLETACEASRALVVGGFTEPRGGRVGFGAQLVGHFDGRDFAFAGKVGTGFDTATLVALHARLQRIERPA